MMHRCTSNSHMGACSCGFFHGQSSNSFSMIFSHKSFDDAHVYPFDAASSSVDCTLSLGTPSTRLTDDDDKPRRPNFCWDFLQGQTSPPPFPLQAPKATRAVANGSGSDPLLARRCANCDTTSTPLWRNGPRGPKSLCNACGIRFKKEERRANANNGGGPVASGLTEQQPPTYSSWIQPQKMPCFSPATEFRFIEDNGSDAGIPFISWRLNVTDRPASLVHDFTR